MESRIWIDGVFDFFHHGHAGVMLQARQQGQELYVGVHSDEDVLINKGPPVMNMAERVSAAEACRWVTKVVADAPYVTQLEFIDSYECKYVVHGDDITSDASGEDCYRFVKRAGRMKLVRRTQGISTTDLVGRMLLMHKAHFIKSLRDELNAITSSDEDVREKAAYMRATMLRYAADETGKRPGINVYILREPTPEALAKDAYDTLLGPATLLPGQRIVYVDGGFDLFSSGHIEFLRQVSVLEREKAQKAGWNTAEATAQRQKAHGRDYDRAFVVVGIHDDEIINAHKGGNFPIMNIFERGLCVLQCKYVSALVFGAPFEPTEAFLANLPDGAPAVVYHGKTSFVPLSFDPYSDARRMGIFEELPAHAFQDVNAANIVDRILKNRERFEERQRKKGVKGVAEEEARRKELEAEAAAKVAAAKGP